MPKKPYGFVGNWDEYLKSVLPQEKERKALEESGQSLAAFMRGEKFGERTGARIGTEFARGYTGEELQPWMKRMGEYSSYAYNYPEMRRYPYWVRGAQLGLSPGAYIELSKRLFPELTSYAYWTSAAQQGSLKPSRELSESEKYIYGLSDVVPSEIAPEALTTKAIERGTPPTMIGAGAKPWVDWFEETYPDIVGQGTKEVKGDRGGTKGKSWTEPYQRGGIFAPRVQTVSY